MSAKIGKEISSLVRKECCNYFDGTCIMLDDDCPQVKCETQVICRWFRNAVLPLDRELERAVAGGNIKPCERCGKSFVPNSNRAKYCEQCAKEVHREQKTRSDRKRACNRTIREKKPSDDKGFQP